MENESNSLRNDVILLEVSSGYAGRKGMKEFLNCAFGSVVECDVASEIGLSISNHGTGRPQLQTKAPAEITFLSMLYLKPTKLKSPLIITMTAPLASVRKV